jgi:hypothetical protein
MGSLSSESFDQFLDSLKQAGVEISNECELRERWPKLSVGALLLLRWQPMAVLWEFVFKIVIVA